MRLWELELQEYILTTQQIQVKTQQPIEQELTNILWFTFNGEAEAMSPQLDEEAAKKWSASENSNA